MVVEDAPIEYHIADLSKFGIVLSTADQARYLGACPEGSNL